jgi:thiamine transport system ATP-binding protein
VASEPAVELDGLTKQYDATTAVADVSIAVERGEFFTLVGPSGCGKTTTLRLIGGFEPPTAGSIRFGGEDVAGLAPEDRSVGVVFQSYALFPHMSVRENVGYGLNFASPPGGVGKSERVDELLELVDLPGMGDRDPGELSGGQQQRVALARALAPGPEILLLDEPMSALDAQLRERLRVQLKTIQDDLGITTVYVTHDQEEALAISDRVAVMREGSVEQVGTPQEIYHGPETRFVAEFIGDNNVFEGEVVDRDREAVTVAVGSERFRVATAEGEPAPEEGERVVFCVRPEAFVRNGSENVLRATVASSEFLGDRTRVHLRYRGRELLARTAGELGGEVTLGFDPADAHLVRR